MSEGEENRVTAAHANHQRTSTLSQPEYHSRVSARSESRRVRAALSPGEKMKSILGDRPFFFSRSLHYSGIVIVFLYLCKD